MKLIFLGTGTSTGVPVIGCNCKVCLSTDKRDKRLRSSVLIEDGDVKILIDSGPDLRQQLLSENVNRLDGILLTHGHYDHIAGLDDVRPLGESLVYGEKNVLSTIRRTMPYCFVDDKYPGVPRIELVEIDETPFQIAHLTVTPIRILHGELPIFGYRIGNLAYLTDVKTIDSKSIEKLQGLDILVLNALRPTPHVTHLSLSEAIDVAIKIGARRTYFTHFNHDIGLFKELNPILPKSIEMAYDGLVVSIE